VAPDPPSGQATPFAHGLSLGHARRRALVARIGLAALGAVLVVARAAGPLAAADQLAGFAGEVARGQAFERALAPGLVFRLVPDDGGWTVWVGQPGTPDADWSGVVTPPFRGPNPRFLEAWHFRNADNSGPNLPGPGNVNAPQAVREFEFVEQAADYRRALDALQGVLWPKTDAERQAALDVLEPIMARARRGRLTITDLELGGLGRGVRPWIERLRFVVEFPEP